MALSDDLAQGAPLGLKVPKYECANFSSTWDCHIHASAAIGELGRHWRGCVVIFT